jgi:hypothetical protein
MRVGGQIYIFWIEILRVRSIAILLDPILRFWKIKFLGVRNLALSSCRIMLLFTQQEL